MSETALVVYALEGFPATPAGYAGLIATGVAAWGAASPVGRWGSLAVAAGGIVAVGAGSPLGSSVPLVGTNLGLVVLAWGAGWTLRSHQQDAVARSALLAEQARSEMLEARWRLADALHNRVGHALVAALRELEAARAITDSDPVRSAGLITRATERTAAAAQELSDLVVTEHRQLADRVSEPDGLEPSASHPPNPDPRTTTRVRAGEPGELGAVLGEWAGMLTSAGTRVRLTLDGDASLLAPQVTAVVAGVLDEALANVAAHSAGNQVDVRLALDDIGVQVEVTDPGPCRHSPQRSGIGISEHRADVELCGGRLSAEPAAGGGFALRAWVPISPCPQAAAGRGRNETVGEQR